MLTMVMNCPGFPKKAGYKSFLNEMNQKKCSALLVALLSQDNLLRNLPGLKLPEKVRLFLLTRSGPDQSTATVAFGGDTVVMSERDRTMVIGSPQSMWHCFPNRRATQDSVSPVTPPQLCQCSTVGYASSTQTYSDNIHQHLHKQQQHSARNCPADTFGGVQIKRGDPGKGMALEGVFQGGTHSSYVAGL